MGKEDFGMLGTTLGSERDSHVHLVDSLLDKHIIGVSCGGWHTVMWSDEGELFVCGKVICAESYIIPQALWYIVFICMTLNSTLSPLSCLIVTRPAGNGNILINFVPTTHMILLPGGIWTFRLGPRSQCL